MRTPVEFTAGGPRSITFGYATDVSPAGAFVQSAFPAAAGRVVVLRVWRPGWDEEVVLRGVVRWKRPDGMGVEFASVGKREARAIGRWLDEGEAADEPSDAREYVR